MNVGDSHFDIMQNILESMIEHIGDIRADQVTTMSNINQVLEYMKQIQSGNMLDPELNKLETILER